MRLLNPKVRTGQGSTRLSREEFQRRWKERFYDPAFVAEKESIDRLAEIAWQAYEDHRKSPRTRKAGPEFADPEYELALEWLEARQQIFAAQKQHEDTTNHTARATKRSIRMMPLWKRRKMLPALFWRQ